MKVACSIVFLFFWGGVAVSEPSSKIRSLPSSFEAFQSFFVKIQGEWNYSFLEAENFERFKTGFYEEWGYELTPREPKFAFYKSTLFSPQIEKTLRIDGDLVKHGVVKGGRQFFGWKTETKAATVAENRWFGPTFGDLYLAIPVDLPFFSIVDGDMPAYYEVGELLSKGDLTLDENGKVNWRGQLEEDTGIFSKCLLKFDQGFLRSVELSSYHANGALGKRVVISYQNFERVDGISLPHKIEAKVFVEPDKYFLTSNAFDGFENAELHVCTHQFIITSLVKDDSIQKREALSPEIDIGTEVYDSITDSTYVVGKGGIVK